MILDVPRCSLWSSATSISDISALNLTSLFFPLYNSFPVSINIFTLSQTISLLISYWQVYNQTSTWLDFYQLDVFFFFVSPAGLFSHLLDEAEHHLLAGGLQLLDQVHQKGSRTLCPPGYNFFLCTPGYSAVYPQNLCCPQSLSPVRFIIDQIGPTRIFPRDLFHPHSILSSLSSPSLWRNMNLPGHRYGWK